MFRRLVIVIPNQKQVFVEAKQSVMSDNVMTDQPGGTHDQITRWQCCMIRTSRFVTIVPPLELTGLTATAELEATLGPVERAFRRKEGPPESKP